MTRVLNGIQVNKDTLALDIIKEIGIGGNFLSHEHTVKNFKSQLWDPELFVRESYSDWLAKGKNTLVNNATIKMEEIIKIEEIIN